MSSSRGHSVYEQCTDDEDLEHKLVEKLLLRDYYVEHLCKLISDVKMNVKQLTDEVISDSLQLLTATRNTTLDYLIQVEAWQRKYTELRRPTCNGGDYMCKLLKSVEIVNTANIKRTFNFQIGRGNLFLLPLPNAKTQPPTQVTNKIKAEVELFAGRRKRRKHIAA